MIQELKQFIINPYSITFGLANDEYYSKARTLLKLYGLCMILLLLSAFPIGIVELILRKSMNFSIFNNLKTNKSSLEQYWSEGVWVITAFVGPVTEEIVFRLPLSKNFLLFSIAIGFAVFYFTGDIINYSPFPFERAGISILLATFIYFLFTQNLFEKYRERWFNIFCWISIITFSWIHINNFSPINWSIIFVYPIYVLPQLFYGISLSYLMVKYNRLVWPILLHILINGVPAIIRAV